MKGALIAWFLIGSGVVAGTWVSGVKSLVSPETGNAGKEAGEQSAGASLLGQFRSSAAASLFERADLYLHSGVALRPMTSQERRVGLKGADLKPGEAAALGDESTLTTAIPAPEEDFRGLLGTLERATTAYKDMHNHTHKDPETTFPLFRLMTWIDPQFIDGWTIGAMLIAGRPEKGSEDRAVEYLKAGLRENPKSIGILTDLAILVGFRKGRYPEALRYLERAHQDVLDGRVAGSQKQDVENMYGWLADMYARVGETARLRQLVVEGLQAFPEQKRLLHYAIKMGIKTPSVSGS
jgi:hypothetical protein